MTTMTINATDKMIEKVLRERRKAYAQMVKIEAQVDALSARIRKNFDARFNGNWKQRKANEEKFLEMMSRRDHLEIVEHGKASSKFTDTGEFLNALRASGVPLAPNSELY